MAADPTAGRPAAPNGLWVGTRFATFMVELDSGGLVSKAPPIARWAVGKRFTAVHRWARNSDRGARFAWMYEDGTYGPMWR